MDESNNDAFARLVTRYPMLRRSIMILLSRWNHGARALEFFIIIFSGEGSWYRILLSTDLNLLVILEAKFNNQSSG
jgi:hypothetical protein